MTRFTGGYFRATEGVVDIAISPTAVPIVLRFSGEQLAALTVACLRAFRGRGLVKVVANDVEVLEAVK